jgi:hypothetical protein
MSLRAGTSDALAPDPIPKWLVLLALELVSNRKPLFGNLLVEALLVEVG